MRAIAVQEPRRVELVDVREPAFGAYEALVRVLTCSLCSGTDRHIVDGSFPGARYPAILGHEGVGRVMAASHQGSAVPRPEVSLQGWGALQVHTSGTREPQCASAVWHN